MLIKLGSEWFKVETVDGKLVKTAVTAPEKEPEKFIDGDSLIADQLDTVKFADSRGVVVSASDSYSKARGQAAQTGSVADRTKLAEAAAEFVVLRDEFSTRANELTQLGGEANIPDIPESITQPNPPAENPEKKKTDDSDGGTKKPKTGKSEDTPDTGDVGDGTGGTDDTSEGDSLSEGMKELATVVAAAVTQSLTGGNVQASAGRNAPVAVPTIRFNDVAPNSNPLQTGTGKTRKEARVLAAANGTAASLGAELDMEARFAEYLEIERSAQPNEGLKRKVGEIEVFHPDEADMFEPKAPVAFHAARAGQVGKHLPERVHADGSSCDDCIITPDVRREIPNQARTPNSFDELLQQYPAPTCELEYYKAISTSVIDAGITLWDDTRKNAFCAARDAWYASLRAGTPDMAQLGLMRSLEKGCAIPVCTGKDKTVTVGVAACFEYPIKMEHCSPELVALYERALLREYQRRKNMLRLDMMTQFMIPVTVDANAAPFTNVDGFSYDAAEVLLQVTEELIARGESAEYIEAGNYVMMVAPEMIAKLAAGLRLSGEATIKMVSDYVKMPIVPIYDGPHDLNGTDAQIKAAQSIAYPYNVSGDIDAHIGDGDTVAATVPPGVLPPTWKQGAIARTNYNTAFPRPNSWPVRIVDLSGYFEIRRPRIQVGAQVTLDLAKQNMKHGLFIEDFFGIGKDDITPSWDIQFDNMQYNGARVAGIKPVVVS